MKKRVIILVILALLIVIPGYYYVGFITDEFWCEQRQHFLCQHFNYCFYCPLGGD